MKPNFDKPYSIMAVPYWECGICGEWRHSYQEIKRHFEKKHKLDIQSEEVVMRVKEVDGNAKVPS